MTNVEGKSLKKSTEMLWKDLQGYWVFSDLSQQGCQHRINYAVLCI